MVRSNLKLFAVFFVPLLLLLAVGCSNDPAANTPATGPASGPASGPAAGLPSGITPAAVPRTQDRPGGKIAVVTTSNLLADWVRAVGQDRVEVFPLLPANADPHAFQPGGRDVARVADADLILSIGLSLEAGWLDDLVANAAQESSELVAVGDHVNPIYFVELLDQEESQGEHGQEDHQDEAEEEGDHDHDALDPHFWFDPLRVKQAVSLIADQLSTLDSEDETFYRDNAADYNRELHALDSWIVEEVAKLPGERRLLVTSHDSFQYFALRYGFKIVGTIVPAATTETEPTAQELFHLIQTIEREGVPAVFAEKSHSQRLSKRIAEETGAQLIGGLYSGSLGEPDGEAGAYLDLMRYNVRTIVEALK